MSSKSSPLVGIVMGSDSDWPVMEAAAEALAEFEIPFEVDVVSAHRMPREMVAYGEQAAGRGLKAIIAGAGGAAHLPGMLAAVTPLPVIGVPVPLKYLDGMDSLLSIVQMPAGVPVATVSVGGARNAGLLAVRMLAAHDSELLDRVRHFQDDLVGFQVKQVFVALDGVAHLLVPGGDGAVGDGFGQYRGFDFGGHCGSFLVCLLNRGESYSATWSLNGLTSASAISCCCSRTWSAM